MARQRRHHNTDGRRSIKRGRTVQQVARIAAKLGVPSTAPPLRAYITEGTDAQGNRQLGPEVYATSFSAAQQQVQLLTAALEGESLRLTALRVLRVKPEAL